MAKATARKLFVILAAATARSFPLRCQAATAALPWDRTVTAMQDMLIGTVAPQQSGSRSPAPEFCIRWEATTKKPGAYSDRWSAAESRSLSFTC